MKTNRTRLSRKATQPNTKRSCTIDLKNDRIQYAERFLSYMDYNSTMFSLEDASYCVKFLTNAPDATSVDPPFCNETVEYDSSKETLERYFVSSSLLNENDKKSFGRVIKPANPIKAENFIAENFMKNAAGFIQYQPRCDCKRRVLYLHDNNLNVKSLLRMNFVECANGFINETPFCVCEPSSANYFTQGTDYACPKGASEKSIDCFQNPFSDNAIRDHIEKIFLLSIFKSDSCVLPNNMLSDTILSKYEIAAPLQPCHFYINCINPQYLGFFEFCTSDDPNNPFRLYQGIHRNLLQWDTELRRPPSNYGESNEGNKNFVNYPNGNHANAFNNSGFGNHRSKTFGDFGKSKITKISMKQYESLYRGRFLENQNMRSDIQVDPSLKRMFCFEHIEYGGLVYRHEFYRKPHQTILLNDFNYGPIIISIFTKKTGERRNSSQPIRPLSPNISHDGDGSKRKSSESENPPSAANNPNDDINNNNQSKDQHTENSIYLKHSIIVRNINSVSLRATLYEGFPKNVSIKKFIAPESNHCSDIISYVLPNLDLSNGYVVTDSPKMEDEILKLDETSLVKKFKVGVLYCDNNQNTEEQIYNNRDGSENFKNFLHLIGTEVRLKGFSTPENPKFFAQLDVKNDRTGTHSIYTKFFGREIMFHVSTMIPFSDDNPQQIDRKRYIGNDIVIIVFQEADALPLDPVTFHTQFTHVVVCVRHTHDDEYFVSVSRKRDVPYFGPPIARSYKKNELFRDFLLTKVINAEFAAYKSKKFYMMSMRTRYQILKNIVTTYSVPSTHAATIKHEQPASNLQSSSSFSGVSNSNQKKIQKLKSSQRKFKVFENVFPISPELFVYNGVSWTVEIFSGERMIATKCRMIIANQVIMFVDTFRKEPIVTIEFSNIYFWKSTGGKRIDIYYKPKNILMVLCDPSSSDEFPYILCRLRFFLKNIETEAIQFEKYTNLLNDLHINRRGIITHVNNKCIAYFSGLRNDTHILEIDEIPLLCLTYKNFIDLLTDTSKSTKVTLTVLAGIGIDKRLISCDVQSTSSSVEIGEIKPLTEKQQPISGSIDIQDSKIISKDFKPNDSSIPISIDVRESTKKKENSFAKKTKLNSMRGSNSVNSLENKSTANESTEMGDSEIDNIFNQLEQSLDFTQFDSDDNWTYVQNSQGKNLSNSDILQLNNSVSSRSNISELSSISELNTASCPQISGLLQNSHSNNNYRTLKTTKTATKLNTFKKNADLVSYPEIESSGNDSFNNPYDSN